LVNAPARAKRETCRLFYRNTGKGASEIPDSEGVLHKNGFAMDGGSRPAFIDGYMMSVRRN